ncbi:type I-B CRISPR-associated endonuclease Cas1b [Natronobacterium gregoryi]|uniref:CRISPR-associated endonuclease Cas1 n=2 Tax=Natronobacterium gregoryi TaxID=44930 RepID=G4G7W6_NATGS|nr:type I-B CRISPR-associated endonuclease Cas1b [Natronobacterium gregoryi]AFZ74580.1 CRISPR-associated endonuclease Cas1 [Natronobacterium gregoryi SP2]ELY72596.1 CRISPR-associated protein Cas1 [Natronobacterium gregoryi SP2]PLK21678.1 type I-B CRISPR-associated endonuclease Cas1 [Natronobacterium gregoryi SP2]SFI94648.1 CRISPR-associated protein, Cas1 family [Natronobacterium gregoryi]
MDKNYHVFSDGRIERTDDTVRVVTDDGEKKYVPIENANAFFLHGQIDFNTRLMSFLNDQGVALHVFGWEDYYAGSVMPERGQTSGRTVVSQVRAYDDTAHRRRLAAAIVLGGIHNMRTNLVYYDGRGYDLERHISELEQVADRVAEDVPIDELLGIEATARKEYYQAFNKILPSEFQLTRREYNPPPNEVNSLISFGNSLVYANCVSAIRATALDPTISYLHEPGERRYSLSLDLADLFKPVLADRVLFRLVNRNQITKDDFETDLGSCLLNETGRQMYTKAFEETLERTVEHPSLNRKVSYQYLMRLEAYKLKKHLLTGESYDSFKRWW